MPLHVYLCICVQRVFFFASFLADRSIAFFSRPIGVTFPFIGTRIFAASTAFRLKVERQRKKREREGGGIEKCLLTDESEPKRKKERKKEREGLPLCRDDE